MLRNWKACPKSYTFLGRDYMIAAIEAAIEFDAKHIIASNYNPAVIEYMYSIHLDEDIYNSERIKFLMSRFAKHAEECFGNGFKFTFYYRGDSIYGRAIEHADHHYKRREIGHEYVPVREEE